MIVCIYLYVFKYLYQFIIDNLVYWVHDKLPVITFQIQRLFCTLHLKTVPMFEDPPNTFTRISSSLKKEQTNKTTFVVDQLKTQNIFMGRDRKSGAAMNLRLLAGLAQCVLWSSKTRGMFGECINLIWRYIVTLM